MSDGANHFTSVKGSIAAAWSPQAKWIFGEVPNFTPSICRYTINQLSSFLEIPQIEPWGFGSIAKSMSEGSRTPAAAVQEMEHLMCFVPGWLALGSEYSGERWLLGGSAGREQKLPDEWLLNDG